MMEPQMIENYILIVFVIVVNHVGFISLKFIAGRKIQGITERKQVPGLAHMDKVKLKGSA